MKVTLAAKTEVTPEAFPQMERQESSTDAEHLITGAGRLCYQSYHRPNPKTFDDQDYIKRTLLDQGHWSIAEHASASFLIEGVSRSLTHELIRHRHFSYSEMSQRFVDVENAEFVVPPALDGRVDGVDGNGALDIILGGARDDYRRIVDALLGKGLSRKQIREAARAVMPNATQTTIVVSGNHRAWRTFIERRWHVAADAEICELAGQILQYLRGLAPSIYADVPEQPYGTED